jgi:site-specific DNA recombinase
MVGTVRYCGRGKSKYVTYRCNQRHSKKRCTNKEIRREYIESYVLDQMQEKLFNEEFVPHLVEQVNEAIRDKTKHIDAEIRDLNTRLADINKQISNIIDAIAQGYDQPSFRARVEQLESDKHQLENLLLEKQLQTAGVREHGAAMINGQHVLKSKKEPVTVTVEQLQQRSSSFQKYIAQTNIPEIKKFISNFVESVVVDVSTASLNMCIWGLIDGGESPCIKAQIQKRQLLRLRIMKSLYAVKFRRTWVEAF